MRKWTNSLKRLMQVEAFLLRIQLQGVRSKSHLPILLLLGLSYPRMKRAQDRKNSCSHGEGWSVLSIQLSKDWHSAHPEVLCELRESLGKVSHGFSELKLSHLEPQAPGPMIPLGPLGRRKLTPISWSLGLGLWCIWPSAAEGLQTSALCGPELVGWGAWVCSRDCICVS